MCLFIEALCSAGDRPVLEAAARAASSEGLQVNVDHESRWPWAKSRPVRATISEDGGCACSLLGEDDNSAADTWSMRADVLEPLSNTLEILASQGPTSLAVGALWVGDTPKHTVAISPRELATLARTNGLGTHTRYTIVKDAG